MDTNITGSFMKAFDPLNTYIENITYDVLKSEIFYDFLIFNEIILKLTWALLAMSIIL